MSSPSWRAARRVLSFSHDGVVRTTEPRIACKGEETSCRGRAMDPGMPDLCSVSSSLRPDRRRTGFLNDPGTFWHVQLARDRRTATSRGSIRSLIRETRPWVDQSWAFDWRWRLVITGAGRPPSPHRTWPGFLYSAWRGLDERRGLPLIAAVVTSLQWGSARSTPDRPPVHAPVRLLGPPRLRSNMSGGLGDRADPILMVAWANIHGGFLAGDHRPHGAAGTRSRALG